MSTVKNLNINRKALIKKRIYKIVAIATAVTLATAISIGIYNHSKDKAEQNQIETIIEYYGENSIEDTILDYITLSEEMDSLNLEKYQADSSLYEKHSISAKLKTPEEIRKLIDDFKLSDSSFSSTEIKEISEYIDTVLNLKKQEQLTNKYIYTVGYSTANENVTDATKKYAAEVFGVSNPENIKFKYSASNSSGEENITMANITDKKYGFNNEEFYNLRQNFRTKEERMISSGVRSMVNTNTIYDKNSNDDDQFNQARNMYIKEALEQSAILEKEVQDKNLYDEKLAGKLK